MYAQQAKDIFVLNVDGKEYIVKEGKSLILNNTKISVKLAPYKKLKTERVSFNYPRNFSYDFEEDPSYKSWILDGNDFVITYYQMDLEYNVNDSVTSFTEELGEKNCKVTNLRKKIGEKVCVGKRLILYWQMQH